ncbi:DUF5060 domain-containing protein [Maribacter algarum]|uniref:DUF5060 domain-containing protein n=1 Tax=Maribacter algarum (ex Zhang et al. 2020) TaxID=2578118 RepID=A0A5S3PTN5_9FLAO|nr:DUF5060 domain-containing protein [Maribacter algarum]TMM58361.1 DUF5060 domain-containing protein [Maribacter algarum]
MKSFIILLLVGICLGCGEKIKEANLTNYQQWHTITLPFEGPDTKEDAAENPFLNYRLIVEFKHMETQQSIRGFYAADGQASETSADSGNVWQVRFTPDRMGKWTYTAQLQQGEGIALKGDDFEGVSIDITNASGEFMVIPSDKQGADFRTHGRLVNDKGYFRFKDSGKYWMKGGADSPENLLAYEDFDGTYRMQSSNEDGEAKTNDTIHSYRPHLKDWKNGDPTWKDGKGKGLIGALNYLSSKGMNVAYFLTMNIKGDGKDVWPYASPDNFTRFDVSKLEQWEIVFQHMQSKGILLHMVLQETENETMLDDGDTGPMRQLYLREMVARFGHHLGMNFNLGEENGYAEFTPISQNDAQRRAMTDFITEIDPYNHPILLHTHSHEPYRGYILDSIVGFKNLDGLSLQVDKREGAGEVMETWKTKARESGHEWMITMDEIGMWHTGAQSDSITPNHDTLRSNVLWGTLLSGGAGVEWYFGARNRYNDLNTEDWRTRDRLWELTGYALDFFQDNLPYWEMKANHKRINSNDAYCLEKPGEVYAIYLTDSKEHTIDLTAAEGTFQIQWFNPLTGGEMHLGTVSSIEGEGIRSLGRSSSKDNQDWVVLLKRTQTAK